MEAERVRAVRELTDVSTITVAEYESIIRKKVERDIAGAFATIADARDSVLTDMEKIQAAISNLDSIVTRQVAHFLGMKSAEDIMKMIVTTSLTVVREGLVEGMTDVINAEVRKRLNDARQNNNRKRRR